MNKHKQGLNDLIDLLQSTSNRETFSALLDLFLTQEEKEDLGMRFFIIKELIKGESSQRDIAKNLDVSIAKITRGSNELKRIKPKLLKYIKDNL